MKKTDNTIKSIQLKSLYLFIGLVLLIFVIMGYLIISNLQVFYFQEKNKDVTALTKAFAHDIATSLEASAIINRQMESKLITSCTIVANHQGELTNEILAQFAKDLDVDEIYHYNTDLQVIGSNSGNYLGWTPPKNHPVRTINKSKKLPMTDDIRRATLIGMNYKYGYAKAPDGTLIQIGILAKNIHLISSRIEPQYIIDQVALQMPTAKVLFITTNGIVYSPTDSRNSAIAINTEEIREILNNETMRLDSLSIQKDSSQVFFNYTPVFVEGEKKGVFVIQFDMLPSMLLISHISKFIIISLFAFFVIFCFFAINIYRKNKRIFNIAYYDTLTGLPNIQFFFASHKKEKENKNHDAFALLLISTINIKLVNIIYGYTYGSTILKQIATSLDTLCKSYPLDLQLYRFSDDRFAISICKYKSRRELETFCNQIISMQKAYSNTETISFGIGVVEVSPKNRDIGKALKEVTIAIEHATILHPVQFFNESMETTLIREEIIVQELKKVFGGASDLFHLEYQPIIDSSNGKIVGFEALSRLTSSKLGALSPMEFIGIAEKNQLIIELGQIILEQAFLFLKTLQEEYGTSLYIAVNISALQLLEESFVSQLVTMADRIGINLEQLRLEITESLFIDNIPFTVEQLKKIHQLGIKVFLDDFGTGYSSISRLEELNIDSIKFDKYFVDRLIIPNEKGVANDIIAMVHHLGKTIVAEGIEKESQKLQLMAMGCDFMQGYLFGKALPPEYILELLEKEHLAKGIPYSDAR